jgi:hypothetical protein
MFWSAELLVALGSTFGVVLDLNLRPASWCPRRS